MDFECRGGEKENEAKRKQKQTKAVDRTPTIHNELVPGLLWLLAQALENATTGICRRRQRKGTKLLRPVVAPKHDENRRRNGNRDDEGKHAVLFSVSI